MGNKIPKQEPQDQKSKYQGIDSNKNSRLSVKETPHKDQGQISNSYSAALGNSEFPLNEISEQQMFHQESLAVQRGKGKSNYDDFVEKVRKNYLKDEENIGVNNFTGSSSKNNLDSLQQKPDPYDAFFMEADKKDRILDALREMAGADDQEYLIQEVVDNRCLFKTLYHYKYHEDLIEADDIMSALILPLDDRLFDQRIEMLELKKLLQTIGKDKIITVAQVPKSQASLKNILMPITGGKKASAGKDDKSISVLEPVPPVQINRQTAAYDPFEDNEPHEKYVAEKLHSKNFLESKLGKIIVKNNMGLDAVVEEQQAMKQSVLSSLRDLNSKKVIIHEKSYDLPAEASQFRSYKQIDSSGTLKGDHNAKSFYFDFQKNVKQDIDIIKDKMIQLRQPGLRDNFSLKYKTSSGRINMCIRKKHFNYGKNSQSSLGPLQKTMSLKTTFLGVPDTLSIEFKSLEELKFKFYQAFYFEVKDPEEAFFYFRVETNLQHKG